MYRAACREAQRDFAQRLSKAILFVKLLQKMEFVAIVIHIAEKRKKKRNSQKKIENRYEIVQLRSAFFLSDID